LTTFLILFLQRDSAPKENGKWSWDHLHNNNLNNNNNNGDDEAQALPSPPQHLVEKRQPQGSPLRSQMSLNLKQKSSPAKCAAPVMRLVILSLFLFTNCEFFR
jgi:hypothetical protein